MLSCDFLALCAPSKSLNQEPSLFLDHCLSPKRLDYLLSFSLFQSPDKVRIVALSIVSVYVCVLLRKFLSRQPETQSLDSLCPHSSSLGPLAP